MPTEPNHKMHHQLKAYAQARRQQPGASPTLHPMTRKMLQDEVVRLSQPGAKAVPRSYSTAPNFWPRLLWGGCGLAALIVVAGVILRVVDEQDARTAAIQSSNLTIFAQSATPGRPAPATPPNPVREQLDSFDGRGKAEANLPAERSVAGPRDPGTRAQDLSMSGTTLPTRAQVALAEKPQSELTADMASNAGRFSAGLMPSASHLTLAQENASPAVSVSAPEQGLALQNSPATSQSAPAAVPLLLRANQYQYQSEQLSAKQAAKSSSQPAQDSLAAAKSVSSAPAAQTLQRYGLAPSRAQGRQAMQFKQVDPTAKYRRNLNSPEPPNVLNNFQIEENGPTVAVTDADGSVYRGNVQPTPTQVRAVPLAVQNAQNSGSNQQFQFKVSGTNRSLNQLVSFEGAFQPATNQSGRAWIQGNATIGPKNQIRVEAQQVGP